MTQLAPSNFKQAEFMRNVWCAVPEKDTPFDALLDPQYWAHVSALIKRGDRIEILAIDSSYFAELLVLDAGRLFAKVKVLRHILLEQVVTAEQVETQSPIPEGYDVKWADRAKWRVTRKVDKATLHDGCETRADALVWLDEHLRKLAA